MSHRRGSVGGNGKEPQAALDPRFGVDLNIAGRAEKVDLLPDVSDIEKSDGWMFMKSMSDLYARELGRAMKGRKNA